MSCQPFDETVIQLNYVVEIFDLQDFDQPELSIKISKKFMFCSLTRLAPFLSIITLPGKLLLPIAQVKNAVAAALVRCSESMKLNVLPILSIAR